MDLVIELVLKVQLLFWVILALVGCKLDPNFEQVLGIFIPRYRCSIVEYFD
jgi:hypothetical protein